MSTDNAILASLARIENLLSQLLAAQYAPRAYTPAPPQWYPKVDNAGCGVAYTHQNEARDGT